MEGKKFTKKQAIKLHRDMWKWIANEISKAGEPLEILDLKYSFVHQYIIRCMEYGKPYVRPRVDCFACEYAYNRTIELHPNDYSEHCKCEYCPFEWFSSGDEEGNYMCIENRDNINGLYEQCRVIYCTSRGKSRKVKKKLTKKQVELAYKIAMLPERQDC